MLADCQRNCWAEQSAQSNELRHFCFLTTTNDQNGHVTRILGNDKGAAEKRVCTAQNIKLVNALLFLLGADPVLVAKVHRLFVDAPRPSEKDSYCCREWVNFARLTCFFATSFVATEEYTTAQNLSRVWLDGWPDDLKFMVPVVPKLEQVKNLYPEDLVQFTWVPADSKKHCLLNPQSR